MTSSSTTEVRVDRLIAEVPSYWEERKFGKSRFRISEWFFPSHKSYFFKKEKNNNKKHFFSKNK